MTGEFMTAYFVIYQTITNSDQFMQYVQAVMPVIARRGGELVAQGTPEVLEGAMPWTRAVVFKWRSRQALLDFWYSDEYAAIRKLREGAAEWQAAIIEGVPSIVNVER